MTRADRSPAFSIRASSPDDAPRLLVIWRCAVEATHPFLAPSDRDAIERQVAEAYLPAASLLVAVDPDGEPIGFMGATGAHIDALFLHPARHGRGVGRGLVAHLEALHPTLTVDVNEQNAGALAFYRRLGFVVRGRSERDDAGRPYPLLHLIRPERPPTRAVDGVAGEAGGHGGV